MLAITSVVTIEKTIALWDSVSLKDWAAILMPTRKVNRKIKGPVSLAISSPGLNFTILDTLPIKLGISLLKDNAIK